jgi:hypothetical protein
MDFFLTDDEIKSLILEEKKITIGLNDFFKMKDKKGHREHDISILRSDGSAFKIIVRLSKENLLDFSAILGFIPPKKSEVFLLRRYNGKSHEHSNRIEKEIAFYDFHIHTATERYQREGPREEYFAEITDRYSDVHGALDCLIKDCNVILDDAQLILPLK